MKTVLSVLVCSLERRNALLNTLMSKLIPQANGVVEVITQLDNGQLSTGAKRNKLLDRAYGKYVCFIDDDDMVEDDYVMQILTAINKSHPDVIGIRLKHFIDGNHHGDTEHSIKYDTWINDINQPIAKYYRCPNHLNPVLKDIAKQVRYPEVYLGEDRDYSLRLKPLIKTEEMIEKPIYFYMERTDKTI